MSRTHITTYDPGPFITGELLRSDLKVERIGKNFVVIHGSAGVLSYKIKDCWYYMMFQPYYFSCFDTANKWVESGCIAEIQEGLSELGVGFMKEMIVYKRNCINDIIGV